MAHDEQDYTDGWQTYSAWIDDIRESSETITKYDTDTNFKQEFLSCESNQRRFEFIWNNVELREEVERYYRRDRSCCEQKQQSRIRKSSEESTNMRQSGNTSFKNSNYLEALNKYTQAIRLAPYPSQIAQDNTLAFALANRSAVLYALTRYRLCLLDIDLAIKYGYPEENMFKLLIRKIKCLHILSIWANDVEQIKDNLRNKLKSRDTNKLVKAEIQGMFEFIEHTQPEEMEKDELDVIDETTMKISNSSKTVSQAADCIEMSYDKDKGRYLIINKDVVFARLLLAEEPFVCNLAPQKRANYCYNCFGCLYSCGLSCTNCSQILYCSEECLNASESIHSRECNSFIDFQEILGVAYLVSHIMFKIDFNLTSFPVYTKKTSDNRTVDEILHMPLNEWPDLVYKNTYASVLSLMDHAADYGYDELMGYTLTATYLMIAFIDQFSKSCSRLSNESEQLVIGSIVLKHLMQLQTNLISILDQDLQSLVSVGHTISEIQEKPIGVGIYSTVSLLNHSCSPNILSIFHRNKFIARAARALDCGSELNYCYGPSVGRMSRKDRQRRLKEQYFFTCDCENCSTNKESESRALVCPECRGPAIYNLDYTHQCHQCKAENVLDVRDVLSQVDKLRSEINSMHETSDHGREIRRLKEIESVLSKLVYWRNPLFVQIKSKLIEMADGLEDMDLAIKFCDDELELCAKTYGEDSYESIMTKLKAVNLKWQKLYYLSEGSTTPEDKSNAIEELKYLLNTTNAVRGKLKELLASTNIIGAESCYDKELKFLSEVYGSINRYLEEQETDSSQAIEIESETN